MERLSKEEYREAKGCLKRYNYNCINIINIQRDILNISVAPCDGLPKAPYSVGDNTLNKVIKLEENEELQKSIREYKAVIQALSLVNYESKVIFEREFRESKYKWDVIDELNKSEETYKRRKRELIYAVHKELNKIKLNLQP